MILAVDDESKSRALRKDNGDYLWVSDRNSSQSTTDGVFTGYIWSHSEIVDLTQNQEKMPAAKGQESLGASVAGVAHDIGNLLGSIIAESDLALSEVMPGAAGRENVERIASLAAYAAQIARTLMAATPAGVDSGALETPDLSGLVEEMLRLLTATISRRAVVYTDLSRDLPAVRGNAAQIRQVIMNLLINASEALGGNQGFITIRTGSAHVGPESAVNLPEGGYVCLMISDTGCGMSDEVRSRIFDQFFTTKSQGHGLGLAAVRGIVQSHGGAIRVTSAEGAGSTFEVWFPCASRTEKRAPA